MVINSIEKLKCLKPDRPLIIMLPFAGGNAYSYREITECFPTGIDVICPEFPGRGAFSAMSFAQNIEELADHIFCNWLESADLNRPYLIFGHSMGALLAYLITCRLAQSETNRPLYLVVSGREGPSLIRENTSTHLLPSLEFREEIRSIGGTPSEILADDDLMNYYEPVLRADFKLVESYTYRPTNKLDVPIAALFGHQEKVTAHAAHFWKNETTKQFTIKEMSGNHFFIFRDPHKIARILENLLLATTK